MSENISMYLMNSPLGHRAKQFRKQPFWWILGLNWVFLKMLKSKLDGPPKMDIYSQNLINQNAILDVLTLKQPFFIKKNLAQELQNVFLLQMELGKIC